MGSFYYLGSNGSIRRAILPVPDGSVSVVPAGSVQYYSRTPGLHFQDRDFGTSGIMVKTETSISVVSETKTFLRVSQLSRPRLLVGVRYRD